MKQETTSVPNFEILFNSLPERYIVFSLDFPTLTMVAASDTYLDIMQKTREQVIGKGLFEVFPDTSPLAIKTGKGQVYRSIEKCIKTKKPDAMGVLRYDIPDKKGTLQLRYWQATHFPVFDHEGKIQHIIQSTTDVTDMVLENEQQRTIGLKFDEILATGLVGSWQWNIGDDVIVADKGLARLFGLSATEVRDGMPLDRFTSSIHKDDRKRVEESIAHVLRGGTNFESEYRTVEKNGKIHWVIARGRVDRDEKGKPISFPGVMIDITDRKEAEEAMKDSEANLRFMADTMPQLVWVARPDGYHEYYNAQWYQYTGTEVGSTDGEGWNNLFHPADQKKAWKKWQHSLKTGENYEIEYRLYHAPSEQYRWVIGRALPMKDEDGRIVKWYGTCTDIDDQKRSGQIQSFLADASKILTASLDYRETLQQVSQMCVPEIADWCSVDMYSNEKGFEQIVVAHADPSKIALAREHRRRNPPSHDGTSGVSKVIKTGQSEVYPKITNEMLEQYIKDPEQLAFMKSLDLHAIIIAPLSVQGKPVGAISFVSTDSGRYYGEEDLRMAEELASRISLAMTNAKLYNDSIRELHSRQKLEEELLAEKQNLELRVRERTAQLQLTNNGLRDEIRKRQRAEKTMQSFSKELERSNQELQDFAYVSSHDLQEPLRKIRAFGDLLMAEYAEQIGDGSEYLERMQSAAARMSTLIEDLLAFSRVSSKQISPKPVQLNAIVSEVLMDLETRINETNATITVDQLPEICADHTHMRQLFQNLIGNALKFHKPDTAPEIHVAYEREGSDEVIRVSDKGIGFEKEYAEKIFAVFQRLHGRDSYEGTGIGLAVCRKIVERYGGTIAAGSRKGSGTTFVIRIPKIKEKKRGK
jgi:PAS domain S-box-containing protein